MDETVVDSNMVDGNTDSGGSSNGSGTNRRTALKVIGGIGLSSLAGCGGAGDSTPTSDDGMTPTKTTGGQVGTATPKSDIAGQEVHFIKGRTNRATVELFDQVARDFKAETGAILRTEYSGMGAGRYERLIQLLQAGDPPEVAVSQLSNAITLWNEGVLAPVTGVMEHLTDQYGPPADNFRFIQDGEEWMVPWSIGFADLWYRRDVLDEAGLGSNFVPDTWDNLETYAQAVTENTDLNGVFMPAAQTEPTMANIISFLRSNEGNITKYENGDWQIAFHEGQDRERMAETLQFLDRLHDNYSPDAGGAGWDEMTNAIAFGVAASNWFPGARPKNAVSQEQASAFAEDVVNVGHNPANRSKNGRASVGPMVVFQNSENPEAGRQFLEFLMGNPEYAADLCWADGPVHCQPPFPGIKESSYYKGLEDSLPDHWSRPVLDRANFEAPKHGVVSAFETDPPNPYMGALLTPLTLASLAQDVLLNDQDIDQAIDNRAQEMVDILDRAKR